MLCALACLLMLLFAGTVWAQDAAAARLILRFDHTSNGFVVENLNTGELRQIHLPLTGHSPDMTLSPSQEWFVWREWVGGFIWSMLTVAPIGEDTKQVILNKNQDDRLKFLWSPVKDVLLISTSGYEPREEGFRLYSPETQQSTKSPPGYYTSPAWTPDGDAIVVQRYFVDAAKTWRNFDRRGIQYIHPYYETQRVLIPYLGDSLGEPQAIDEGAITTCFNWTPSLWWLDSKTFVSLSRNKVGQQGILWKDIETNEAKFMVIPELLPYIQSVTWNKQMEHALIHFTNDCEYMNARPQLGLVSIVDMTFHLVTETLDQAPLFVPSFYYGGELGPIAHYVWLNSGTEFIVYDDMRFQLYDVKTHTLDSLPIPRPAQPLYSHHSEPDNISIALPKDDKYLFVAWSGEVWRYTFATQEARRLAVGIHDISLSPDDRHLAVTTTSFLIPVSCPRVVCILDVQTSQISMAIDENTIPGEMCGNVLPYVQWEAEGEWLIVSQGFENCFDVYSLINIESGVKRENLGCNYDNCFVWLPPNTPFDERWGKIVEIPQTQR